MQVRGKVLSLRTEAQTRRIRSNLAFGVILGSRRAGGRGRGNYTVRQKDERFADGAPRLRNGYAVRRGPYLR